VASGCWLVHHDILAQVTWISSLQEHKNLPKMRQPLLRGLVKSLLMQRDGAMSVVYTMRRCDPYHTQDAEACPLATKK
jgi:hypothetical protein